MKLVGQKTALIGLEQFRETIAPFLLSVSERTELCADEAKAREESLRRQRKTCVSGTRSLGAHSAGSI